MLKLMLKGIGVLILGFIVTCLSVRFNGQSEYGPIMLSGLAGMVTGIGMIIFPIYTAIMRLRNRKRNG